MPIGSGIVYNTGDLILSQVSSSGTAFLETKIAAATSSLIYFDSTARINSASLNSITVGTASYVSGSTSIITNLTASNISASGRIIASVISSSNAYFSDIGFTNQTVAPDTSVFPTGSTSDGLILDGGTYTNGLYRTRFVKVDRSSNLPLYIQETTSTSGSFRNLARFGTHANSPNTFEVFGSTNIQGAITSSNFVGPHIGNTTGTSSWSTNALTASSLVAANSYAVNNFTASNISCSGYLQSAAAVYQQITSSTFDSASYSNQWVRIAKFDFNIPGTIPFGGFFNEFALKIIANPVSGMQPYSDRFVSPSVALTGSNRGNYANLLISNASYAATPSINVLNAYTYGTALVTKIRSAKDAGNSTWYVDAFITNQSASAVDLMRVEIDSGRGQLQWQLNPSTASYTSNVEFDITIPGVKNANSYVYNFDGNVTSSGNILVGGRGGIGTTSPSEKLHVVGNGLITSGSAVDLRIDASSTGNASLTIDRQTTAAESKILLLDGNVSQWGIAAKSNSNNFVIRDADSTERFTILKTNGNIGIGTINPDATLQVAGNVSGSSFTSSISNAVGFLGTSSWAINASTASYVSPSGNAFVQGGNSFGTTATLGTNDASALIFETNGTGRVTIDTNGNVGIGTTSPVTLLTVGSTTVTTSSMTLQGEYQSSVFNNTNIFNFRHGGFDRWRLLTTQNSAASNDFDFSVNAINAAVNDYNTYVTVKGLTGNVGIGTTLPNSKLEVAGTAGTAIVSVNNTSANRSGSFGIDGSGVFIRNSNNGDYFDLKNASGVARFRVIYDNATHLTTNFVSIGNLSATGSKLSVFGNTSIGSTYGSTAAPTNGLIVEGNVGIGTTVPGAKLEISASSNSALLNIKSPSSSTILYISGSGAVGVGTSAYTEIGGNGYLMLKNVLCFVSDNTANSNNRNWSIGTNGQFNGDLYFVTSAGSSSFPNDAYRISFTRTGDIITNGSIGVGTTVPVNKLQVNGNVSGSSFTSSISNAVGFLGTSSWAQNVVSSSFATTAQTANALNTGNSYTITNLTASNISASLTGSFGYVGIGTNSPTQKLHIQNGYLLIDTNVAVGSGLWMPDTNGNPSLRIVTDQSSANFSSIINNWGANTNSGVMVGTVRNDGTAFQVRSGVTVTSGFANDDGTTRFTVNGDGNVGIGTTVPSARLHVTGSTGGIFEVDTAGGATTFYVSASGNVGIGTANATDKLTLYGALASYKTGADTIQTQVYLANTPNTRAFNVQLNSGGTGLDLWSYNSSNAWLKHTTFNYDGNVGIGTAAPAAKLEITGSSNSALLNIKSPISGAILYVSGSGAVGIGTSNVGAFTLQVSGSFGATTKSFIIDHPTKAGKKLMYGSLESPYHGIRLTGRDTLVNGKCKVELPDYMYKLILHDSINIQLTGIKCNKTLYVDDINIPENYFTIAYDKAIFESYKDYDFFWDFTAIRADVPELTTEL